MHPLTISQPYRHSTTSDMPGKPEKRFVFLTQGWLTVALFCLAVFSHGSAIAASDANHLLADTPPQLAAGPDWHYTVRPNDTIWKIAQEFLRPPLTWMDLVKHNQLATPKHLAPGTSLSMPVDWLKQQPSPAVATAVSGEAWYRRHHESRAQLLPVNTQLNVGDEIRTGKGNVLLRFADGSLLRMTDETQLTLNRLTKFGKTGMADTRMRLEKGNISTSVTPQRDEGSRYEIYTPAAVAAVRGTGFRLKADQQGTQMEVTDGKVFFSTLPPNTASSIIPAGQAVRLFPGSKTFDLIEMLPGPAITANDLQIRKLPLILRWAPVSGAEKYLYQLYRGSPGGELIEEAYTKIPQASFMQLSNGPFTFSVTAISPQGISGLSSEVILNVVLHADAAKLIAPANNQRVTADLPEFSWQLPANGELARLEISESHAFDKLVATSEFAQDSNVLPNHLLPPGKYFWRVKTVMGSDAVNVSEIRDITIVDILPKPKIASAFYTANNVRLFWKPIVNALAYKIEISEDVNFGSILKDETIYQTSTVVKLSPGKRYYARLIPIPSEYYVAESGPGYELYVP